MFNWWNQTVTRLRAITRDERGTPVPDWSYPDKKEIKGCSVQPAATSLSQDGRILGIMDGMTCYMPVNADVKAGDRIEFEGEVYVINGDVRTWPSPTGAVAHKQANLERWSG